MPETSFQFPTYAPDSAAYRADRMSDARGWMRRGGVWWPVRRFGISDEGAPSGTVDLNSAVVGLNFYGGELIAGTASHGAFAYTVSGGDATWGAYAVSTPSSTVLEWQFAKFGQELFLCAYTGDTNGKGYISQSLKPSSTPVSTAGIESFLAGTEWVNSVGEFGDFLAWGIEDSSGNNYWRWSGINDPEVYTLGENSSDIQEFPNGGKVWKSVPMAGGGLLIQESAIRRVVPDSRVVFTFAPITETIGIPSGYAGVQADGILYGWSGYGFFAASMSGVADIGDSRVNDTVGDIDRIFSAANTPDTEIIWTFNTSDDSTFRTIRYNYVANEWSGIEEDNVMVADTSLVLPAVAIGSTYDGSIEAYSPNPVAVGASDDAVYLPFTGTFSGESSRFIETGELQLNPNGQAIVTRVTPFIDQDNLDGTFKVYIKTRDKPYSALGYQTGESSGHAVAGSEPSATMRVTAAVHKIIVEVAGTSVTSAHGVRVEYELAGAI